MFVGCWINYYSCELELRLWRCDQIEFVDQNFILHERKITCWITTPKFTIESRNFLDHWASCLAFPSFFSQRFEILRFSKQRIFCKKAKKSMDFDWKYSVFGIIYTGFRS